MDSVIIAMILVAVLAGGIVTFVHQGRTRIWGLIAILLSVGVSIILYNFTCLLPNWKNVLLTTSACIIILVAFYFLLAIGNIRRNRPMNPTLMQNMDREAVIPSSCTPVPISDCKLSVLPTPAKTVKEKKAASRIVLKQVPAAYAKKARRSAAVEYTPILAHNKTPHESPAEAVLPEPVLPAENTGVAALNVPERSDGEIAERICSSSMEDEVIKADEASEQLEKVPADPSYITPSAQTHLTKNEAPGQFDETHSEPTYIASPAEPRLVEYETLGQSVEAPTESEYIVSSAQTRLVEYETPSQSGEAHSEPEYFTLSAEPCLEYEILGQPDEARTESEHIASSAQTRLVEYESLDRSDEACTESKIFKSVESRDLGAENNSEHPTKQIASEPSQTSFKDDMEEIIQLVSAKRYADAQAGIFKMISSGYTMTANDKQQLLLIMKLLREKEKRADGATHTR